jgi:hypothetical protein
MQSREIAQKKHYKKESETKKMKKTNTNTTKKANTKTTKVEAITNEVETVKLDFDFLRRNQTKVLKADAVEELKNELEKVAEVEVNNKYNYAFNIIIDSKKFCEVWGKTDILRVTICKRNLEKLAECKVVNLEERKAIRQEKDTHEEYVVDTEFVLTREEVIEILKYITEYAKQKTEEKKAEEKKAKQSKAKEKK